MNLKKYSFLALFLLAGCSSGSSLIGGKGHPDEMAVISGPPLTLPPSFELRPPAEQKESRADAIRSQDPSIQAQKILLGKEIKPGQGEADPWIAEQAGTKQADPNIREILDEETTESLRDEDKESGFLGLFGEGDDE